MFLEESNRRIRENGINSTLSCINLFQNISRLPDHCHKTQRMYFAFFPYFSRLISDSDHFFRDP